MTPRSVHFVERFWSYVNKTDTCWLWTGKDVNWSNHARFRTNGRRVFVHRFAYEQLVGPIPEGLVIDHVCGVPLCVNPAHLEAVTSGENQRRAATTIVSINSAKTTCPKGHPYDRVTKYGKRICRRCRNEQMQACRDRKR